MLVSQHHPSSSQTLSLALLDICAINQPIVLSSKSLIQTTLFAQCPSSQILVPPLICMQDSSNTLLLTSLLKESLLLKTSSLSYRTSTLTSFTLPAYDTLSLSHSLSRTTVLNLISSWLNLPIQDLSSYPPHLESQSNTGSRLSTVYSNNLLSCLEYLLQSLLLLVHLNLNLLHFYHLLTLLIWD
jgi:hypothetical protein